MKAVFFDAKDNTAVALADLAQGTELELCAGGVTRHVRLIEPITYQHKFSVLEIKKTDPILKYGQVIGEATCHIPAGSHVHVHNMVGLRLKSASLR